MLGWLRRANFQRRDLKGLTDFAGQPFALALGTVKSGERVIPIGASWRMTYWSGAQISIQVFDSDSPDYGLKVAQHWMKQDERRTFYRALVVDLDVRQAEEWSTVLILRARNCMSGAEFLYHQPYARSGGEVIYGRPFADMPADNLSLQGKEAEILDGMAASIANHTAIFERNERRRR